MRSVSILFICVFMCSLFGGCYDYIIYQPSKVPNIEDPKDKIRTVLLKQRHILSREIEVTDEYIALSPIYYDDIKYALLYDDDNVYVVKVLDRNKALKLFVVSYDLKETKEFIDALAAMGCRLETFPSD